MEEKDLNEVIEKEFRGHKEDTLPEMGSILTEGEKSKLEKLHEELERYRSEPVTDSPLKKKIAKFSLDLAEKTVRDKQEIMETSYILTSFGAYEFNDDLDKVFEISGDLELPEEHVPGNVFDLWDSLVEILESYI